MNKATFSFDERMSASTIKLYTASGDKFLVTSEGTKVQSPIMLVWSMNFVTGKDGPKLSSARHQEASTQRGWEYLDTFATPEFMGETTANRVKLQLEGVTPKAGRVVPGGGVPKVMAMDATKQDYYITGHCHPEKVQVRYGTMEDCIDAAVTGKWTAEWS